MNKTLLMSLALSLGFVGSQFAAADESAVKEVAKDVAKNTKKVARAASDKACPIVHGKAKCAVEEGKSHLKNGVDEVKDKLD